MSSNDPWKAVRTAPNFEIWRNAFVGNGYLGLRVAYSGEGREIEDEAWYSGSVMCAGLYADWSRNPRFKLPYAVQLPNFLHFEPGFHPRVAWRNDPWVEWDEYRQELDFRHSTVTTRYRLVPNGYRFTQKVWAHRTRRHLVFQEMSVAAGPDAYEMTTAALNPLGHWKNFTQGCELTDSYGVPELDAAIHHGAVPNTGLEFAYAERLLVSPGAPPHTLRAAGGERTGYGDQGQLASVGFVAQVPPQARFTVVKVTAFCDSRIVPAGQLDAFVRDQVAAVTWDQLAGLRREHEAAWERIWELVPEFDHPKLNLYTPALLYILFTSMGSGLPVEMQVCGNSNTRPWMGRTFEWDQTIFVFPGLLLLLPEWTRDLMEGELRAYARRRELGRDPKSNGTPAHAMRLFYYATGDAAWFKAQWPRVCELMENLERRAIFNPTLGQYEIRGVHPADERGPLSADNNIYTNAANWYLVKTAIELAELRGEPVPESWRRLDRCGFFMPYDEKRNGYIEYARWTPDGLRDFYDGHERKQGDVELAYFPMEILTDRERMKNDLDYYAPRITKWGAPEMQNGWFAALETILGRPERAVGWLEAVVDHWAKEDFRIFTEMQGNSRGLFSTGAGDCLCGLLYGLVGVRVRKGRLHFLPALCPQGLHAIRCRKLHLAGAAWAVDFRLQEDGRIAYQIREVDGARNFAGTFERELSIEL